MFKWIKALGVAALLAIPSVAVASDGPLGIKHEIAVNTTDQLLNAAGETSTSISASPFEELTIFVSGTYSVANVVWVQKEVGSPGSGAWENFFQLDLNTANARVIQGVTNGPTPASYRLIMATYGTGDVVAYMTNYPRAARDWTTGYHQTHVRYFDDFLIGIELNQDVVTVVNEQMYLGFSNTASGNNETLVALDETNLEGALIMLSSDGSADEVACVANELAAEQGVTVGDGWISVEGRVAWAQFSGKGAFGFTDTVCVSNAVSHLDITGTTVAANGATDSLAMIAFDDGATSALFFHAISAISNAEGANAVTVVGPATPTADDYAILRVEIDNLGNAFFFVNNVLFHAEPLAVTVAAEVIWMLYGGTSATTTGIDTAIDYIEVIKTRPSTPTT